MSEENVDVVSNGAHEITYVVDGKVSVKAFAAEMTTFANLLAALSGKAGEPSLEWNISPIPHKGAAITALGFGDAAQAVAREFRKFGPEIARGKLPELDGPILSLLAGLVDIRDTGVETISFIAFGETWTTKPHQLELPILDVPDQDKSSKGKLRTKPVLDAVRGTIHTISNSNRDKIRLVLRDTIFNKTVVCHLSPSQESIARQHWAKPVIVTGFVRRVRGSGRPDQITEIHEIQELPAHKVGWWINVFGMLGNLIPARNSSK